MSTSSNHWRHAREIFEVARTLDAEACRALLEKRCGGDAQLRRDVQHLLDAHRGETNFLENPVLGESFNIHELAGRLNDPPNDPPEEPDARSREPADAMIGRSIGPYRLLSRIGDGGMGSVYLADRDDRTYTKKVAIKLIKRGMDSEAIVRRFEAERQILANLEHPGIARLIDGGMTDDGRPYIVMEYVDGTRIDTYCDENALSIDERIDLFREVCAAVHAAHQNLVVHRDLKPSNILITNDGQVKLLDFGIAKTLDPDPAALGPDFAQQTLTMPHERRLTLRYASPEQLSGGPITTASDVYSLGVILFELLTGSSPHTAAGSDHFSMEQVIRNTEALRPSTAVQRTNPEETADDVETRARLRRLDPRSLARRLHGDLDTVVLMSLRKEPGRRYGSAQQFAEDLRRYQLGLPVVARPDTWRYRTGKFIRRNALGVSAGVLVLLTLSGLLALSMMLYVEAREAREVMAAERDRAVRSEALAEERRREAEAKQAIAEAVNRFLNDDLLAFADTTVAGEADVSVREVLDNAAAAIGHAFDEQPEVEAAVRLTIGQAYRSLGLFDRAEEHILAAVRMLEGLRGRDDHETMIAFASYGKLLRDRGEYDEARKTLEAALAGLRETLGEDHEAALETMTRLADVYSLQGRYDDAERLHAHTVERCLAVLGERHRLTIVAMSNLATLYEAIKRYEEAEELLDQAFALSLAALGKDHRRTLVTMNNLATLYYSTGRLDSAEQMFEEVAARQERILGERHPSTLVAMSNLATIYTMQRRNEEAEPLLQRTLELRAAVLGEDHPNTLRTMNSLATLYINTDRHEKALPLCERVFRLRSEKLGPDHALTMNSMNTLGTVYRELERYEDALRIYEKLVNVRRETLGENNDATLTAMHNLARIYRSLQRYDESLQLMKLVNEGVRETLPEGHWRFGVHLAAQAESLRGLQRHSEAIEFFQRAYEIYMNAFGKEHVRTRNAITAIAELCEEIGDAHQAVEWRAMLDDDETP